MCVCVVWGSERGNTPSKDLETGGFRCLFLLRCSLVESLADSDFEGLTIESVWRRRGKMSLELGIRMLC